MKTKLLTLSMTIFATVASADDYYEERETCAPSGRAIIYLPTNFDDMASGDVRAHSESVNGSGVSFEKGAEPFIIKGNAYHYVDAIIAQNGDGTADMTQGLMLLSDMSEAGQCEH